ncbi:MAG TPA: alpha/beta fold hydrolase [Chitinophagaceae bacterium]|nr:alpha/beta fold hydrolase [Chitinophagaceae bacterium]
MKKKIIFRWVKVLVIAYCVIGIALYYLQDKLLFHPEPLDRNQNFNFNLPNKEVNIPFNATSNLNLIQFTTADTPRGVVLYFHGNRKNISHYAKFVPEFTRNGYEVWMMDYPGFGKSTGEFSEQRIYDWSLLIYNLSRKHFSPDSIIIFGKSMGTGIAAQLAAVRDTRRLILETPYYSLPSIIGQYAPIYPVNRMIHFKIPTYKYLQRVTAPITIFQGTADWIIWHSNAYALRPFLKPGDEFISIQGGRHNNLHQFTIFQEKLDSVLTR